MVSLNLKVFLQFPPEKATRKHAGADRKNSDGAEVPSASWRSPDAGVLTMVPACSLGTFGFGVLSGLRTVLWRRLDPVRVP